MARLRTIRVDGIDGLKGQTFEQPLSGCDLFVGPNGSGKSTRLVAVLAAARGLAEASTDPVREYLGPTKPRAEVALVFEGGATVTRDLSAGSTSNAGKRATILAEQAMGAHVARWDLADFARATDADRAKLLERICSAAGAGGAWTLAKVDALLRKELGIARDAALPGTHPLARALSTWSGGKPVGAWLTGAVTMTDEAYTEANAAHKRAEQDATNAAAKLDTEPPVGTLAEKRAELARIQSEGETIKAQLATAQQAAKRTQEIEADRQRTAIAVDAAEQALAQAEAPRPEPIEVARAQAALVEARRTLAGCSPIDALQAAVTAAEVQHAALLPGLEIAKMRLERATHARDRAQSAASGASGAVSRLAALVVKAGGSCRHCQGEDPIGLVEELKAAKATAAELEEEATAAEELLVIRRAAVEEAAEVIAKAATALQLGRDALAVGTSARATADRAVRDAEDRLERAHFQAQAEQDRAAAAVTQARERLDAARSAHAVAESRVPEAGGGDLETLTASREALAADYRRLAAEVEALVRHEERQRLHQEAIAARETAAERFRVVKALKAGLAKLRTEVAASAYGPIQDAANAFLVRAELDMTVVFHDESDFGAEVRQRDGSRPYVAFWALSDAQRAEFAVALAVALSTLTKAPWRGVLVDGLEKVERRALHGLLTAANAMVTEGALDNFIGTFMADREGEAPHSAAVHWLGGTADAAREVA